MKQNDIPVFPVAAMTIAPVPRMGMIIIRPDFLSNLTQPPQEAQTGRTYALTPVQAQYVVEQIQRALATLASAETPDGGGPLH